MTDNGHVVNYDRRWIPDGHYHIAIIGAPESLLNEIAKVALYWGHFENELNKGLQILVQRSGPPEDPNWLERGFRKRKELFRELLERLLPNAPEIHEHFKAFLGDVSELHWKRNALIHGKYIVSLPPKGSGLPPKYRVEATHKGRQIKLEVTYDVVAELWHAIALAGGAFVAALIPDGTTHALSLPHRQLLHSLLGAGYQSAPTPEVP